jgi:CRISPR/Cas system-associated exonuclease Cas4 (RecB family)
VRESLAVAIRSKIPVIREQVQVLLSRMKWTTRSEAPVTQNGKVSKNRSPLVAGTHFEVELKSQSLKWKGIADLIQLNEDGCVITDFKTGEKQEQHRLQLLVYGLLWRGDAELNPGEELPNRLVISYPNGDEVIAPVVSKEIDELSDLLKSRTTIVRNALQIVPPKAILSPDNCPSCDVRILCQDYWTSERTVKCGAASRNDSFDDLEIVLIRRLGQLSWEAAVKRSDILRKQTKLVLRLSEADALLQEQFSPNRTLRLTNALHSTCDEGDIAVVRITSYTEPLFDTN